ncbi:MAG: zinc-binding dehydrogenase [Thermoplasmatales archaeon]|nr:zinc-binding dehydrogenase [Thermoplasmatales archaeon]
MVGAGGGTATAALQIAKLRGATVAVVSRSAAKAERARSLGADAGLTFDESHPLDRVLWEWSGKRGVDLIFDSVGSPTIARSLQAISRGGRIVVIGATAGSKAEIELRTLFWRQASIRGSTMASAAEFTAMLHELTEGRLRPVIDSVHPFESARAAFLRLGAPDLFGKVVVKLP